MDWLRSSFFAVLGFTMLSEIIIFTVLYLHEGKPQRPITDAQLRRRGWIVIASMVAIITTVIGAYILSAGGLA